MQCSIWGRNCGKRVYEVLAKQGVERVIPFSVVVGYSFCCLRLAYHSYTYVVLCVCWFSLCRALYAFFNLINLFVTNKKKTIGIMY